MNKENLVSELILQKCFDDWPTFVETMKLKPKNVICRLQSLINKESIAKEIWMTYFLGQMYLNFEKLSLDDCIFFFLKLEDNMALKAPGIYRLIGGHLD